MFTRIHRHGIRATCLDYPAIEYCQTAVFCVFYQRPRCSYYRIKENLGFDFIPTILRDQTLRLAGHLLS